MIPVAFITLGIGTNTRTAFSLLYPPILYDRTGNYVLAFRLGIGVSLAAIVCMWKAAPRKVRVVAGQVARLQAQRQRQTETA